MRTGCRCNGPARCKNKEPIKVIVIYDRLLVDLFYEFRSPPECVFLPAGAQVARASGQLEISSSPLEAYSSQNPIPVRIQ